MQRRSISAPSPQKLDETRNVVRSLWVIYNTGLTYQTDHVMFRRVVAESMGAFDAALKGLKELPLFFVKGQVRYGSVALEQSGGLFQKVAEAFESKGISNLSILPGLTSDELTGLIKVMTASSGRITGIDLEHELKNRGVKHIRYRDVQVELVDKQSALRRKAKAKSLGGKVVASSPVASTQPKASEAEFDVAEASAPETLGEVGTAEVAPGKSFKNFVQGTLEAMKRDEASATQVAELISAEFDQKLGEKIEEVQFENEKRVRRLESIKDVILKQLEELKLAAIVVDSYYDVLAANESGRKILGGLSSLEKGSPLELLIASRQEEQVVEIDGVKRIAHFIASSSTGGASLVTLQ